ncbi:MAG: M56 family metallopeptidase, partial [bacterium]|nr:M56 family metallopeptidase [bacterium]
MAPIEPPAADWRAIAGLIYSTGLILLSGRLILGLWFRRRFLRGATVIEGGLLESSATRVPVTLGWVSPRIILPLEWRSWEGWKLRAVLAHERAHVRRRDALIGLLASLNVAIYWFHPLAWWLLRRVAVLAEQASDDAAICETGDARRYAEVVLEVARKAAGVRRLEWAAISMAGSRRLEGRIDRILDSTRDIVPQLTARQRTLLLACGVPLVVLAIGVQLVPATAPGPPAPPAPAFSLHRLQPLRELSDSEASRLERHLKTRPDDIAARAHLLKHYGAKAEYDKHLAHLVWFVKHRPELALFNSRIARAYPATRAFYEHPVRQRMPSLWLQQAERFPEDPRILGNAAWAIEGTDPRRAAELYKRAWERGQSRRDWVWSGGRARIYAAAIRDSVHDTPVGDPELAKTARAELAVTDNPALLRSVARICLNAGAGQ